MAAALGASGAGRAGTGRGAAGTTLVVVGAAGRVGEAVTDAAASGAVAGGAVVTAGDGGLAGAAAGGVGLVVGGAAGCESAAVDSLLAGGALGDFAHGLAIISQAARPSKASAAPADKGISVRDNGALRALAAVDARAAWGETAPAAEGRCTICVGT